MYDTSYYSYNAYDTASTGLFAGIGVGMLIFYLLVIGFILFCLWKLFTKAGKPGWASLVPIYNVIVELQIAGLPEWYVVLLIVPIANIYLMFKLFIELAHKFGKSTGFGVLTVFFSPICIPILALGSATYNGSASADNTVVNSNVVNNDVNYNAPINNGVTYDNVAPVNNQVVQEPVVNAVPVNNQTVQEPVVNTMPVNNQTVQEPVVNAVPVNNQVVQEPVVNAVPVNNQTVQEPVVNAVPVNNQVVQEPVVNAVPVNNTVNNNMNTNDTNYLG